MTPRLSDALEEYIELRRSVGFKLETHARVLPSFVEFLERRGAQRITCELALDWATQPHGKRDLWAVRLSYVRGFARYLNTIDPKTEVPQPNLLPQRRRRSVPFLYTKEEIKRLIRAARDLHPPTHAWTYATLIGLVASTGMRRGEVIKLDVDDVDWGNGLLVIRKTKYGKSRELPLHRTTLAALKAYSEKRDHLCPKPLARSFFVSLAGTRLLDHRIHKIFARLVRRIGLKPRSALCRPRLHDLRHTFAVETLLRWYRAGLNVDSRMPLLSTYLGHFNPSSTYWYLSATPELLSLSASRLELAWEDLP